jgi:hypothetical protein
MTRLEHVYGIGDGSAAGKSTQTHVDHIVSTDRSAKGAQYDSQGQVPTLSGRRPWYQNKRRPSPERAQQLFRPFRP